MCYLCPDRTAPPLLGHPFSTLTNPQLVSAVIGVGKVIAAITPRPRADFDLLVRADTLQPTCTLFDNALGGPALSLVRSDGQPFSIPSGFDLPVGTAVRVTAYTDRPIGPCGVVLEVVTLASGLPALWVTSIPAPPPIAGQNLLPDDWELFFFGTTGIDPFAKPPGSQITYLQLFLDGKDPCNPASFAGLQPVLNALPQPEIFLNPGNQNHTVFFTLPPAYADDFQFQLLASDDLTQGSFLLEPNGTFQQTQPGRFELATPPSTDPKKFWRVGVTLK
jgi:hypothetical protein